MSTYRGKEEEDSQTYDGKMHTWEVGLKEDNTTNRAAWRDKIISYTGDPRLWDKPGKKKKNTINIQMISGFDISRW